MLPRSLVFFSLIALSGAPYISCFPKPSHLTENAGDLHLSYEDRYKSRIGYTAVVQQLGGRGQRRTLGILATSSAVVAVVFLLVRCAARLTQDSSRNASGRRLAGKDSCEGNVSVFNGVRFYRIDQV